MYNYISHANKQRHLQPWSTRKVVREPAVEEERGISTSVADLGRRGEGCVAATVCGIHVNDTDTQSIVHCAVSPALVTTD